MAREELDDIMIIISDLRMAMDIKEQIEAGEERGLIDFADGESIKVPVPEATKQRLDDKINQLKTMLKQRVAKIKE